VAACFALVLVSCSDEEGPVDTGNGGNGNGGDPTWSWRQQSLPAYDLFGLHTTPMNRLVAVGEDGVILTHDGHRWVQSESPANDDLWDVHGTSHDNLWAVGDNGAALHFDGSTWNAINMNAGHDLRAVHVIAPDTLYVAGTRGGVFRYYGSGWTPISPISPAPGALYGLWAAALDNLYAVGVDNQIHHYLGGSSWSISRDIQQPNLTLRDVWGMSASDIFVVGDEGYTTHYDGSEWQTIQAPTTSALHDVSGTGWGAPTAVGANGGIYHYSASRWWAEDSGTSNTLYAVNCNLDAADKEDCVAVGMQTILESRAGGDWNDLTWAATPLLNDVWGDSEDDIYAVGEAGTVLRFDGSSWARVTSGDMDNLVNVWRDGSDVLVADEHGEVYTYDGSDWSRTGGFDRPDPAGDVLNDAWQIPGGELICVGEDRQNTGVFAMRGGVWTKISPQALSAVMVGVWGRSDDFIVAVGTYGQILRWNGTLWEFMNSGTTQLLTSVWGSERSLVYAVGHNGTMLYYDGIGDNWQAIATGLIHDLQRVWGTSVGNVFAVGNIGAVVNFDSFELTSMFIGTTAPLIGVWQDDAGIVTVVGGDVLTGGVIYRYEEDESP
jgi:hypothetical protein